MIKVYLAIKMTGREARVLDEDVWKGVKAFSRYKIIVLSPWYHEFWNYSPEDIIRAKPEDRARFWNKDKELIRESHVIVDMSGNLFSRGACLETGMMRYGLMRPTVWVDNIQSVRNDEGDIVVSSLEEAAKQVSERWGTWGKRAKWRLKTVWNLRSIYIRLKEEIKSWR